MDDEWRESILVQDALNELNRINPIWNKNRSVFWSLNPNNRIIWWRRAKRQAELGAPAMQTLLLKVIELRLTK